MPSEHVSQYMHQLALKYVFYHFKLFFLLLPIYHPLAVKFVLTTTFGHYKVKSHGDWEIEEFNPGAFLLNDSLTKTRCLAVVISHVGDWEIEEFNPGGFLLNDPLTKTHCVAVAIF
jgi:hypothetical protein